MKVSRGYVQPPSSKTILACKFDSSVQACMAPATLYSGIAQRLLVPFFRKRRRRPGAANCTWRRPPARPQTLPLFLPLPSHTPFPFPSIFLSLSLPLSPPLSPPLSLPLRLCIPLPFPAPPPKQNTHYHSRPQSGYPASRGRPASTAESFGQGPAYAAAAAAGSGRTSESSIRSPSRGPYLVCVRARPRVCVRACVIALHLGCKREKDSPVPVFPPPPLPPHAGSRSDPTRPRPTH